MEKQEILDELQRLYDLIAGTQPLDGTQASEFGLVLSKIAEIKWEVQQQL